MAVSALAVSACETTGQSRTLGATLGAALGYAACKGLAGGTDTECVLAALAAGAAGYVIADRIDARDRAQRDATVVQVLEDTSTEGESVDYAVAETGSVGEVKLLAITTDAQGRQCKRLEETYTQADGEPLVETYTMCQQADGQWANA